MTEIPEGLTPANQNPWYVLMTLYGEQEGEEVDGALHARNRAAWNAWACQGMDEEERAAAAKSSLVTATELSAWPEIGAEVETLHLAAWTARNPGLDYPGLPDPGTRVDLGKVVFERHLVMSHAVFSGQAWFGSATFSGRAWFESATFSGAAWFDSATFSGEVRFDDANFNGEAWFYDATFSGQAGFGSANFRGEAWFISATFNGFARFTSATFSGETWFLAATFSGEAWFISATFGGFAQFSVARFGQAGGRQTADFVDCQFAKPTRFDDAIFQATYPKFSGAILHDQTAFTDHPDHWPKGPQPDPSQAKASCAVIRHTLGRQGLPEAEHFFYRREMGFAGQIGGWWQRLPYRAFGALSDYGFSIARPALWLLGLWVAVAMVNHVVLQWGASMGTVAGYHPAQAFGLSFANLFPIFGLHKLWFAPEYLTALNGWLKLLGGVQAVLSLPLLFFLGLGLRTRFRLR